jgi:hypothetical protein
MEFHAAINAVSVAGQATCRAHIEAYISEIVGSLKALTPLFRSGSAGLAYDIATEARILGDGEPLVTSIARLGDKELIRLWYWYTRNRAKPVEMAAVAFSIQSALGKQEVELPSDLASHSTHWLSFDGTEMFSCGPLELTEITTGKIWRIRNAAKTRTVDNWIPRYEASNKHGPQPRNANGEEISEMNLTESAATRVLLDSVKHGDKRRYGYWQSSFYEFRLTRVDAMQEVFHGFAVSPEAVPPLVRSQLVGNSSMTW